MRLIGKNFRFNNLLLTNFANLTARDKEIVRLWRNNSNITRWFYSDHLITKKEHNNFISNIKKDTKNSYWLAKTKKNAYVGIIYLNRIDMKNRNAYLGVYANPVDKFPAAGSVLMHCLKRIAFSKLKLHALRLEVMDNNLKAIRFYRKSGFRQESRMKDFVYKNRRWVDVLVMTAFAKG